MKRAELFHAKSDTNKKVLLDDLDPDGHMLGLILKCYKENVSCYWVQNGSGKKQHCFAR